MKYTKLPHTDIKVSKICLGTMTYGEQNTEAEGHAQLDYAVENGVNFIDTAELYPVPAKKETYGSTERIIGNWLSNRGKRDDLVIASKIAGPGAYTAHIRNTGFSAKAIEESIENSLKRLQTDYIDLFQLHWPTRPTNCFGVRNFPTENFKKSEDNYVATLESLDKFIQQGKIRHIGLSNETAWGMMKYIEASKQKNLPRPITIQNSFSMIHRTYEIGMSEVSLEEEIELLAYSPMAFGVLSGKYLDAQPKDARVTIFPNYNRYSSEQSEIAVRKYLEVAKKHGLSLAELSLAFVNNAPFVTSNIIGASKLSQLKENINTIYIDFTPEMLADINAIHAVMPNPAP